MTIPRSFLLLSASLATCVSLIAAAPLHSLSRFFAPELLPGTYARTRAFPPAATCPTQISLSRFQNTDRGVSVPHNSVTVNGNQCTGDGEITLGPTDHSIELPAYFPLRRKIPMLESALTELVKAKGTFLGISINAMTCGQDTLPQSTVYAFVNDTNRDVALLSGRLKLQRGRRHMVLFIDSVDTPVVCAYEASPGSAPTSPEQTDTSASGTETPAGPSAGAVAGANKTAASPSPNATATGTSKPACFAGRSTVRLSSGATKRMSDLQLGDAVQVSATEYSPVFMFTHRLPSAPASFLVLHTASGRALTLTAGHLLYVDGALAPARTVARGAALTDAAGERDIVLRVRRVQDVGLYNPQTVHGDIVVDGVRASSYTEAVAPLPAHALLAPMRAVYAALGLSSAALDGGAERLLQWGAGQIFS